MGLLVVLAYVAFRIGWVLQHGRLMQVPDSPSYYIANWPRPGRPPVAVLIWSTLGQSRLAGLIVVSLSCVAFLTLAKAIAAVFPRARYLAAAPLLYSLAGLVMGWDVYVLSESLAISGTILVLAGAVGFCGRPRLSRGWAIVFTAGAVLSIGSKESATIFAFAGGLAMLLKCWRLRAAPGRPTRIAQIAAHTVVLLAITAATIASSDNPLPIWLNGETSEALQQRVTASNVRDFNLIYSYVEADPEMHERWAAAGMPEMPPSAPLGFRLEDRYQDPAIVDWVDEHAAGLWRDELLSDPATALGRIGIINLSTVDSIQLVVALTKPPRANAALSVLVPQSGTAQIVLNGATALAMLAVLIGVGRWNRSARTTRSRRRALLGDTGSLRDPAARADAMAPVALVGLFMSAAAAIHLIAVVNLDSIEQARHALLGLVATPPIVFVAGLVCAEVLAERRRHLRHEPDEGPQLGDFSGRH